VGNKQEADGQATRRHAQSRQLAHGLAYSVDAVDAAGGALFLTAPGGSALNLIVYHGDAASLPHIRRLVDESLAVSQVPNGLEYKGSNVLIVPLCITDGTRGCLAFWLGAPQPFDATSRRVAAAIVGQMALLLENQHLSEQAECEIVLAERARLAREIHDGPAQTLSYLKMRIAQIARWSRRGEHGRAGTALGELEDTLADAYADVRAAIDGLRVDVGSGEMDTWLGQVVADFSRSTGLPIHVTLPAGLSLPAEAQVQLVRIVQEALSNVRRHAAASQVWIDGTLDTHEFALHIVDDGRGFVAGRTSTSHHGLRIMRERAELLDAGFQVASRPGTGTDVVVRLPTAALYLEETDA
jgi:two-component system nitrate/nitrite sensor histidine kinase NarX